MIDRRHALRLGIAASFFTLIGRGARAVEPKTVFKASDVHPEGYPTVQAVENMGKKLEAATGGRLSIQMYASMQLGGEKEAIEQAQVGALQFARVSSGLLGPVVDDLNVFNLPFLFRNTAHMDEVIDDVKGLKVRVMGNPMFVDMMNAIGGNGVAMGYDQVFSALQTGVVDGAENNPPSFYFDNHYQVAKFYTLTEHLIVPEILVFSRPTWDTLSKDDQALIKKLAREAQLEERRLWNEKEQQAIDKMKAAGIEIITISDKTPFQKAVKPVWDKYGAKYAELIKRIQMVN